MITGAEIIEANRWLYREIPNNDAAKFQLWDFSTATQVLIDTAEIQLMAQEDKQVAQSLSPMVTACVAPDDLMYGLARMWEAYVEDDAIESHVFRDFASAEQWIRFRIEWNGLNDGECEKGSRAVTLGV